jgi:amino acid permease
VRFWAFLGKGTSKTREMFLSTFPNKSPDIFSGWIFLILFFRLFSLRWLSASRQGELNKRDKKCFAGSCVYFFRPCRFFVCVFGRFSIRGTQKRDLKNHEIVRASKQIPGQIKYVRTLVVFFYFFFCRPLGCIWPIQPAPAADHRLMLTGAMLFVTW